jgi:hypothetical protein
MPAPGEAERDAVLNRAAQLQSFASLRVKPRAQAGWTLEARPDESNRAVQFLNAWSEHRAIIEQHEGFIAQLFSGIRSSRSPSQSSIGGFR